MWLKGIKIDLDISVWDYNRSREGRSPHCPFLRLAIAKVFKIKLGYNSVFASPYPPPPPKKIHCGL